MIDAAILCAVGPGGETLVGRRRAELAFLGGFTAFPGGASAPEDAQIAARAGRPGEIARATALRELWEETGLIAIGRRLVVAPEAGDLEDALARAGAPIDLGALVEIARFVTPSFWPTRFSARTFALEVDAVEAPRASGELEALRWTPARAALEDYARFRILLAAPTLATLEAIAEEGPSPARIAARLAAHPAAEGRATHTFDCTPGIVGIPLLTPTLPPAIHTNCYLVGARRLLAVDPATYLADERATLIAALEAEERRGARLEAVLLTHHHGDHIGSARFLAEARGVPIWAHRVTAELLAPKIPIDRLLEDGERVELGDEAAPFPVELWHTPGHAPGHLVLVDRRPGSGAMIVGDMVASVGTIVIDPPEGDMAEYLRQLERLRARGPSLLFPAHGMPIVDGRAKLEAYVAHRLKREALVRAALERADTIEGMLPLAYADTPEHIWPLAARSCLAHLLKLVEDGVATREGDRFLVARPV